MLALPLQALKNAEDGVIDSSRQLKRDSVHAFILEHRVLCQCNKLKSFSIISHPKFSGSKISSHFKMLWITRQATCRI
jgi:hypothetical protein